MRQLTSLDAQFLALENARQSGHVGGLAILDPSTTPSGKLELADVQQMIAERLPLLPPMRWRLAEVPFGLDYPYWVDDPDFDLDFHVRELALPPPGTDEKLAEQVARIVARPLDRARPLWELYLIHGLEDGSVAMLTKIHHAAIDGLSGAEIMGVLFDLEPQGRELPELRPGAATASTRASSRCSPAGCSGCRATRCGCCARCRPRCRTSTRPRSETSPAPRRSPGPRSGCARRCAASARAASSSARPTSHRGPRSTAASHRTAASSSGSSRSTR